jgi:hypothetical protein
VRLSDLSEVLPKDKLQVWWASKFNGQLKEVASVAEAAVAPVVRSQPRPAVSATFLVHFQGGCVRLAACGSGRSQGRQCRSPPN